MSLWYQCHILSALHLRWQKMISPSNWPFLKNHCIWTTIQASSIIQASKLVLGSLLAKNNFFVQFWTKICASSLMANCGSGLPAEWPFRSQNAIEASDSPLPGGLWVKRLITHALCSLAYSDIAWCKLFLILTMKGLCWVFFAHKTTYSVLIDYSIHIQEIDTEITWLTLQGQIF